jgi:hypothetical protein
MIIGCQCVRRHTPKGGMWWFHRKGTEDAAGISKSYFDIRILWLGNLCAFVQRNTVLHDFLHSTLSQCFAYEMRNLKGTAGCHRFIHGSRMFCGISGISGNISVRSKAVDAAPTLQISIPVRDRTFLPDWNGAGDYRYRQDREARATDRLLELHFCHRFRLSTYRSGYVIGCIACWVLFCPPMATRLVDADSHS